MELQSTIEAVNPEKTHSLLVKSRQADSNLTASQHSPKRNTFCEDNSDDVKRQCSDISSFHCSLSGHSASPSFPSGLEESHHLSTNAVVPRVTSFVGSSRCQAIDSQYDQFNIQQTADCPPERFDTDREFFHRASPISNTRDSLVETCDGRQTLTLASGCDESAEEVLHTTAGSRKQKGSASDEHPAFSFCRLYQSETAGSTKDSQSTDVAPDLEESVHKGSTMFDSSTFDQTNDFSSISSAVQYDPLGSLSKSRLDSKDNNQSTSISSERPKTFDFSLHLQNTFNHVVSFLEKPAEDFDSSRKESSPREGSSAEEKDFSPSCSVSPAKDFVSSNDPSPSSSLSPRCDFAALNDDSDSTKPATLENVPSPHETPSPENSNELPTFASAEDWSGPDARRTLRNNKRKRDVVEVCPVCGVTVRVPELKSHYAKEVENLSKVSRNLRKPRRQEKETDQTFVQVKNNRENRLTAKVARYSARAKSEVQCPVCSLRLSGTVQDVNKHVLLCLSQDENSDEFLVVDGEDDDESFEEYEFGDQTRIRPISFVPGGHRTLLGHSSSRRNVEDDEDLNVDVDDTLAYGQPQYTELDVIPSTADGQEEKELQQLRKAVLVDSNAQPHVLESRKWSNLGDMKNENLENFRVNENPVSTMSNMNGEMSEEKGRDSQPNHVVSSLKEKIRDLEEQNKDSKCLICMETYTKPVVSTACWHVHCEECWLMTMGVKKLCPQCNMIVFPSDLRRIYL